MKRCMILVAGGSGTRMGADIPKQFIEVDGKPILVHTLQNFHAMDKTMKLILVLPKDQFGVWNELVKKHQLTIPHILVEGGATRFMSVKNGLDKVTDADMVGIHDGVRPFVSASVVEACFASANAHGAAIPVVPIIQSLRLLKGDASQAVDRADYRAVQTPQCFQKSILKKAFDAAESTHYSDDASVVEAFGQKIALVEGNWENIKITTQIDLKLAQLIIDGQKLSG